MIVGRSGGWVALSGLHVAGGLFTQSCALGYRTAAFQALPQGAEGKLIVGNRFHGDGLLAVASHGAETAPDAALGAPSVGIARSVADLPGVR